MTAPNTSKQTSGDIPLLDPTINVQNLLAAAVVRLNDLSVMEKERVNERTAADMLRVDQLREAEVRRISESIEAERRRVDKQLSLREHYENALREAEAKRIDANRSGDAAALDALNKRVSQLERMGYEGSGKEKYSDPVLKKMMDQVDTLVSNYATGSGKGTGANQTIIYAVMALSALSTILAILNYVAK